MQRPVPCVADDRGASGGPSAVGHVLPVLWGLFASLLVLMLAGDGTLDDRVQQQANEGIDAVLDPDVVVVLIDEASVAAADGFAGRAGIACLVRAVAAQRPAVIALDYVFDASDALGSALPPSCGPPGDRLESGAVPLVVASTLDWSSGVLREVTTPAGFVPDDALHGYADIDYSRRDGVVRTVRLFEHAAGAQMAASFALMTWAAARTAALAPDARPGPHDVRRALQACVATGAAPTWLDCSRIAGPARRTIRFFPPADVLGLVTARELFADGCDQASGPACVPENFFKGKIVFIGDGRGTPGDMFETPLFSDLLGSEYFLDIDARVPELPGVVVHALIAQNLLTGTFTREPTALGFAALTALCAVAVGFALGAAVFADVALRRWTGRSVPATHAVRTLALLAGLGAAIAGIHALSVHALAHWSTGIHPLHLMSATVIVTLAACLLPHWSWRRRPASGEAIGAVAGRWASAAPERYAELLRSGGEHRWYALTVSLPAAPLGDCEMYAVARLRALMLERLHVPDHAPGQAFMPLLTGLEGTEFSLLVAMNSDLRHAHEAVLAALRTLADLLPSLCGSDSVLLRDADTSCWTGVSMLRIVPAHVAAGVHPLIASPRPGETGTYRLRLKPRGAMQ